MEESKAKVQIYFGIRPPKNWRLNSILQKDPVYQNLRDAWDEEADPLFKEQKGKALGAYRAKVRKEHNLPEE